MKVVINKCHGGFSLSHEALIRAIEKGANFVDTNTPKDWYSSSQDPMSDYLDDVAKGVQLRDGFIGDTFGTRIVYKEGKIYTIKDERDTLFRTHPLLLEIINEIGEDAASGEFAELKAVDVPDGVDFEIAEYDGLEWVAEKHRTWG